MGAAEVGQIRRAVARSGVDGTPGCRYRRLRGDVAQESGP